MPIYQDDFESVRFIELIYNLFADDQKFLLKLRWLCLRLTIVK